jgi:membrane fusion protein (multidrug efflux system)
MKKFYFIAALLILIILSACTSAAQLTPLPTVSLDDGNPAPGTQTGSADAVSASAIIVPLKEVQLAFSSVGRVTAVNVKAGDRVSAGQILVTLDTTILEARVREAEANLLAAEVQLKYNRRLGLDEVHIESSEADVARMQALVESAKAVLATQSTLTAPFNGTIVSLDIAPAETVVPGQVVMVLGDLSKYRIETTDLSERDVNRVQVGQPAVIYIEALDQEFNGEVIDIDRIGSMLGGEVVYKVTIDLDEQPNGLLWGMSADVRIDIAD